MKNENCTATTDQRSIDALGHNWKDNERRNYYMRNGCKETHNDEWDAGKITTEPTCTEQGKRHIIVPMKKMEFWTATKTEDIKKLGHKYILTKKDKPTCESEWHSLR